MSLDSCRLPYGRKRLLLLGATWFFIVLSGSRVLQSQRDDDSFAFVHVTIIDGTGDAPKSNQTVLISRDRIQAVGDFSEVKTSSAGRIVDGTGRFLIPGLWDAHVHTRCEGIDHLRLLVANGITSARDMGGGWEHFDQIKRWREEIRKGTRIGPRFFTAGSLLDGPDSAWSHAAIITGPDEARVTVQRLKDHGGDFVKVYDRLNRESFFAIVDEAKRQNLPVAGHVPDLITAGQASDAGLRSIEHLDGVVMESSSREEELMKRKLEGSPVGAAAQVDSFDPSKARVLAARLQRNQTRLVPTLVSLTLTRLGIARKDPQIVASDRLRYIPAPYREAWALEVGRGSAANLSKIVDGAFAIVGEFHRAGAEIVAGTDVIKPFVVPGFSLHDELSLLVRAGLSEMEAIEAATRRPARLVGLTDRGTVETGMVADLVLLDADPLINIDNTRRIAAVVTEGRLTEREALKMMLADVERTAARWAGTPCGS
jgi:imidazolonepropionase-like amidohydrolase